MATDASAAYQDVATTDAQPTGDNRIPVLDSTEPVTLPGGTVIFVYTYRRTNGEARRYDGDVPTHVVGIYSERDVREALAGTYTPNAIERGERMPQANATEAIRYAERHETPATDSEDTSAENDAPATPITREAAVVGPSPDAEAARGTVDSHTDEGGDRTPP